MLGAAIRKDTQLLLRDRGALVSLFVLPVVFMAVFGAMFGGGSDEKREARILPVHYRTDDPRALAMIQAIDASGAFRTRLEPSAERVRELVAREEHTAGLIIPPDFEPRAGRPMELVIDEALPPAVRGPVEGALDGIVTRAYYFAPGGEPGRGAPPSIIAPRAPPGVKKAMDSPSGFQVAVPGNAVLFGFFLALTVAISFTEEKKTGTWRRLLAAPVSRPAILLAKLVPYTLVGLCQFAFLFGVGILGFGLEVSGSVLALVVLTAAVVLCATSLGLLIASFGGTQKQVGGIGSITLLVMGLLGGAMIPRLAMTDTMKMLGLLVPHAWALEGYYDVLVREGTTIVHVGKEIAALLGFAALFAAIGSVRFRFER